MTGENLGVLITFLVYLVLLVVIGRLSQKTHTKSYEDFVSADKSLGALVTAISAAASSESVWVMLGLSGLGYWKGLAALWAALGCVLGFVANALFVTVQLRRDSGRLGSVTVSDYIESRLGDTSGMVKILSSLIITFFMLSYVVAQFTGAGDLFKGMALLDEATVRGAAEAVGLSGVLGALGDPVYVVGVLVGAFIIAIYIVLGGYAAVCWTDTVQGILMFVVMLGLPILAVIEVGGFGAMFAALEPTGLLSLTPAESAGWAALGFVVGQLGIGIGYPGMPHMIIRYMTVSDERSAKRSAWIALGWSVVVLFGSTLVGLAARALWPDLAADQKSAEQLVIPMVCRSFLPSILTGVVISAVTAAIMSTADSQLMYASTSLINDLWLRGGRSKEIPPERLIRLTRIILLVMTAVAMAVALAKMRLIYTFVLFAWGALGAAFTPIIVLSLYWRRMTRWGALASLIVGPTVIVVWYNVAVLHDAVYELIPASVASLIAAVVVSLLTWRREADRVSLPDRLDQGG
jgi:sodium/proline symporter